ncbi:YfaP family protein [Marinobacter salicampi]|uniref:YfaP family protein n=1 Tax=Marinobacter salicampi TaxID=435907 RepID=UPI00140C6C40|nr:hypothetical protein [Marinobacter salicampi]
MRMAGFVLITLFALISTQVHAEEKGVRSDVVTVAASNECAFDGYGLGFFNGVGNTPQAALASLIRTVAALRERGADFDSTEIAFNVFYNQTNGTAIDVLEAFSQRAEEADFVDRLGNAVDRMEVFWLALSGQTDQGIILRLRTVLGNSPPSVFLSTIREQVFAESLGSIADLDEAQTINATHRAKVQSWALEGRRMMMVAHSQGNLFVNQAYAAAIDINGYDGNSVGVVHVAPAAGVLNGPYTLATSDLVIEALRVGSSGGAFDGGSLPAANVVAPFYPDDASGHGYSEVYLNRALPTYEHLSERLIDIWSSRSRPSIESNRGLFTATMVWSVAGDIDLHTFEPDGSHVYYGSQTGTSGRLEYDDTRGTGPEHYDAYCDPSRVEEGTYQFGVNNYGGQTGTTGRLLITTSLGRDLLTETFTVGEARGSSGDGSPQILGRVEVTKREDPDDREQIIFDIQAVH